MKKSLVSLLAAAPFLVVLVFGVASVVASAAPSFRENLSAAYFSSPPNPATGGAIVIDVVVEYMYQCKAPDVRVPTVPAQRAIPGVRPAIPAVPGYWIPGETIVQTGTATDEYTGYYDANLNPQEHLTGWTFSHADLTNEGARVYTCPAGYTLVE